MSTWNDKRLDEGFKEAKGEMRTGFARVDGEIKEVKAEIKEVRQEMKEGFAQMRGEMNQRFNTLIALIGTLIIAVLGAGIFG